MAISKLRFGMVGGGNGGNIGNSHRRGSMLDNLAELSAGAFTRNSAQNIKDGTAWGVAPDRIYANYEQMARAESERPDGIDFVTIVTPNETHYPIAKTFLEHGIHVVCEKPFTVTVAQAAELEHLAAARGLELAVTYTYPHYPIMRHMRAMIKQGKIGKILNIAAEYPQDWYALLVQSGTENWFDNPEKAGISNATAGIGVHLWYLIQSMTGLSMDRVLADFGYYPEDANLESISHVLFRMEDQTPGVLWSSVAAAGHDCSIQLKVYGEKGSIEWSHNDPTHLRVAMMNEPVQILAAQRAYLDPSSAGASRLPAGHPEGFYEAFANIYRDFCRHLLDKKNGREPGEYFYPTAQDGVEGMRFIYACVQSHKSGNTWVQLRDMQ